MNLIIVESPTKARTLSKFLGAGYVVEATTGHIKDLPKSKLGIDIENDFAPDYVDVIKRKDTIATLKSKSKKAKIVFIATDPDREGEAIAQHVFEILDAKILNTRKKAQVSSVSRISFHEITKEAVEEAMTHPGKIDKNLVDAQIGRRVLDRLVGYKLSPLLWKKVRRGLSAGRVQSVAVRLIVEKEREIEKFKADEYWEIFSEVSREGNVPRVPQELETRDTRDTSNSRDTFIVQLVKQEVKDKKGADEILTDLEKAKYKVQDVKKREVKKSPYPPFTTSTMTQTAARVFGWSSKRTMSTAQKLYEEGLITYHRTDSLNLSLPAVMKVRDFVKKEFGVEYLPEKPHLYKTNSKSAQEAHEAIRPTAVISNFQFPVSNDKYGEDNKKLYELIWTRFVACQMNPSVYDETTIDVSAMLPTASYLLRASGQIMKFDGWRRVIPAKSDKDTPEVSSLPNVEKDEELDLVKTWGDQKYTQPPARFNEASLIKTLEKLGIGRPSTYAPTINTIQVRAYVEKNDNRNFIPTTIGVAVNDFLIGNFPETFDYQFTALMEAELDEVANGKLGWVKTIKDFWKPFEKKLVDVEKNSVRVKIETEKLGRTCPECDEAREAGDAARIGELVIRTGRFGKFISCSLFPDCKHTEKLIQKINMKCPDCKVGEVVIKRSKRGRKFFGCSKYPACKYASWKNPAENKEGN